MVVQNIVSSICDGSACSEQVLRAMAEPIRLREEYIRVASAARAPGSIWSEEEWNEWLSSRPLSKEDMEGVVASWKEHFSIKSTTVDRILTLRATGEDKSDTTKSKNAKQAARKLARGAWKSYVHKNCISFPLAMNFLCYPPTEMKKLMNN